MTAAAEVLDVHRPARSSLLCGKADLSGEMALRNEKASDSKMDTLMPTQSTYDIARTGKLLETRLTVMSHVIKG